MSPLLTWQQLSIEVLHDSFETDQDPLHFSFSSTTPFTELACLAYLPLRRLTLARKKVFWEIKTEK